MLSLLLMPLPPLLFITPLDSRYVTLRHLFRHALLAHATCCRRFTL